MMFFSSFIFILIINYSAQTFVDLGHELKYDIPVFPRPEYLAKRFQLSVIFNETMENKYWLASYSFCSGEHLGTHVDAPYHFYREGWTMEEIPLEHFIAPAVVIDVTKKAAKNPNYLICAADVEKWVADNGMIPNNSVIIGRTGWSKKFNDPVAYLGNDTDYTKMTFPGFGTDSIRRVLDYRTTDGVHAVGFGIDTISLDHGPSRHFDAHVAVHGENLYIIENLNKLEVLPPKGATLFVMPMKIKGGTGGPARIIAHLPTEPLKYC